MLDSWVPEPSRRAGLDRLAAFVPKAPAYGSERNFVVPPHASVSRLSAYIRHRLVLEPEVVSAVLAARPPARVEKLVSEVLWRTYWKGWLEHRPQVWEHYLARVATDRDGLTAVERDRLAAAESGRTGIACLDAWVRELTETGYLHNHARMWFASIWIFTLRLPWTLGAACFLRHLLDGDPASNTLSWRWVAGLHTRGKHYLARAENIARYTAGAFDPRGELDEQAAPLTEEGLGLDLQPRPIAAPAALDSERRSGLLLTPEDLAPEHSALAGLDIAGVAGGWDRSVADGLGLSGKVVDYSRGALTDALARAEAHFAAPVTQLDETDWVGSAEAWARGLGVDQVVTLYAPVGPWRERLARLAARLATCGIRLAWHRRPWDERLWPGAAKGFFQLRKHAERAGLTGELIAHAADRLR